MYHGEPPLGCDTDWLFFFFSPRLLRPSFQDHMAKCKGMREEKGASYEAPKKARCKPLLVCIRTAATKTDVCCRQTDRPGLWPKERRKERTGPRFGAWPPVPFTEKDTEKQVFNRKACFGDVTLRIWKRRFQVGSCLRFVSGRGQGQRYNGGSPTQLHHHAKATQVHEIP